MTTKRPHEHDSPLPWDSADDGRLEALTDPRSDLWSLLDQFVEEKWVPNETTDTNDYSKQS